MKKNNHLVIPLKFNNIKGSQFSEKLFDKKIEAEEPVDVFVVAKFLGKKPGTVRHWISTGSYDIPHFRLGNKSMFFLSEIVEWCKAL